MIISVIPFGKVAKYLCIQMSHIFFSHEFNFYSILIFFRLTVIYLQKFEDLVHMSLVLRAVEKSEETCAYSFVCRATQLSPHQLQRGQERATCHHFSYWKL